MFFVHKVFDVVKRHFVSGVLVVVPLILTYLVLKFLFEAIDGILKPALMAAFGYYIPGLGVLTTVLLIILTGLLTRNFIGHRLYRTGDRLLRRMPLIRPIYGSAKQLLEAMASSSEKSFKEVGLVEYPRRGVYAMGFIARRFTVNLDGVARPFCSVFVASTPTPVSGTVIMVPEHEVIRVNMTIEEGIKFLVSGGVATPGEILGTNIPLRDEAGEVES